MFFVNVIKRKTRSVESCGCLYSAVLSVSKSQRIATTKLRPIEGSKQHAVMLNEAKVQSVTKWKAASSTVAADQRWNVNSGGNLARFLLALT
jgi:hypothetical protein